MSNIFDIEDDIKRQQAELDALEKANKSRSGLASFIAGTLTLGFIALVAPIYVHILVEIAIWSWNLI